VSHKIKVILQYLVYSITEQHILQTFNFIYSSINSDINTLSNNTNLNAGT